METNLQIFTEHVEPQAVNQIYEIVKSPAMSGASIRIMPDVHQGKGCVIGFTAKDFAHVIPNLIGVDISCGELQFLHKTEIPSHGHKQSSGYQTEFVENMGFSYSDRRKRRLL